MDDGVHFRMAKGKRASLSKLSLGTPEFSLLSLAQASNSVEGGARRGVGEVRDDLPRVPAGPLVSFLVGPFFFMEGSVDLGSPLT